MKPKIRRALKAAVLSAAVAAVPATAAIVYSRNLALERAEQDLAKIVDRLAGHVDGLVWSSEGILADVDYIARRYGCGEALIEAFSRNATAHRWVSSVAYVTKEGRLICADLGIFDLSVEVQQLTSVLDRQSDRTIVATPPITLPFHPGPSIAIAHPLSRGARAGDWVVVLVPQREFLGGVRSLDLPSSGSISVSIAGQRVASQGQIPEQQTSVISATEDVGILGVIVEASVGRKQVLAVWWSKTRWYAVASVLTILGFAVCAAVLASRRSSIVGELREAIANDELEVYYQPVINLAADKCVGAEALIRWRHPEQGLVSPDTFIALAESTGDIVPMTRWLMHQVSQEIGALLRTSSHFHIAINLAPVHFDSRNVIDDAQNAVQRVQVNASQILFEVTERGLVDEAGCRDVIDRLKELGYQVAVDDFGTGYSSLSYVEKFRLDFLKIDKAFVKAVGTEAATADLASVIINMAHTLNLRIIAEGVETETQLEFLKARGVHTAQGWYFAKAMPAQDFLEFVEDYNGRSPPH